MAKENEKEESKFEKLEDTVNRVELFVQTYEKQLLYALGGIVVVVAIIVAISKFYIEPQDVEAQNQMTKGQEYFAKDSFQLALDGDGVDYIGFRKITDEYSLTASGNLANAYTGICLYKLGKFENALSYLKEFDGDDINVSVMVNGLIGDCYVELKDYDNALDYYKKAYDTKNPAFSPVFLKKAGIVYEEKKDFTQAIALYTQIKDQYVQSSEAQDIDKYIERANLNK